MHRFQHLYLPPLYGILDLKSRSQHLTEVFCKHSHGPNLTESYSGTCVLMHAVLEGTTAFREVIPPWMSFHAATAEQPTLLCLVAEFYVE